MINETSNGISLPDEARRAKVRLLVLILLLLAGMTFTAYTHVGDIGLTLSQLSVSTLTSAFPLYLLFAALAALVLAVPLLWWNLAVSVRVTVVACTIAWLYYGVMLCIWTIGWGVLTLLSLQRFVAYVVVSGLLVYVTRFAYCLMVKTRRKP